MSIVSEMSPTQLIGRKFAFETLVKAGTFNRTNVLIYGTITGFVDVGGQRHLSISVPYLRLVSSGGVCTLKIIGVTIGKSDMLEVMDVKGNGEVTVLTGIFSVG